MLYIKKEDCTGCSACFNVCPHEAINMLNDKEGFSCPSVDEQKCHSCGKCNEICPIINFSLKNTSSPSCYGAWVLDKQERLSSSSGGIFPLLARYTLETHGKVCGAGFNKDYRVEHSIISNTDQLHLLKGSKYVQSDLKSCFKNILELLENNYLVLFSGTPCQVAGLYAFLDCRHDNLITIDLLCHGTPSQIIFEAYLKETVEDFSDIKSISFRDKIIGWYQMTFSIKYLEDSIDDLYEDAYTENLFMQGFHQNLYLRPSCYNCRFVSRNRVGDITLGDFWDIEKFDKKLFDNKGTSLVLINNDKGRQYYKKIRKSLAVNKEFDLKVLDHRFSVDLPSKSHENRELFFDKFNGINFEASVKKALKKDKIGVVNFHFNNNNYGAFLICYATLKIFEQLGYNAELIDFRKNWHAGRPLEKPFRNFTDQHLSLSQPCYSVHQLKKHNRKYDIIVVGGDQLWRWHLGFTRFLNWVLGKKVMFSFSTSFGDIDTLEKFSERNEIKKLLSRFDAISVREHSGVEMCKRLFTIHAIQVADPTLLIDINHYEQLINQDHLSKPTFKYVGFMSFFDDFLINDPAVLSDIKQSYPLLNLQRNKNGVMRGVAEWLNYIKHAEYIITSSYHGALFSILFKKQFVTFDTKQGGNQRISHLLESMGITKDRMYQDLTHVNLESFNEKIIYDDIDPLINNQKEIALKYLTDCLNLKSTYKHEQVIQESLFQKWISPFWGRFKNLLSKAVH